jgi:hypothetical protein
MRGRVGHLVVGRHQLLARTTEPIAEIALDFGRVQPARSDEREQVGGGAGVIDGAVGTAARMGSRGRESDPWACR